MKIGGSKRQSKAVLAEGTAHVKTVAGGSTMHLRNGRTQKWLEFSKKGEQCGLQRGAEHVVLS